MGKLLSVVVLLVTSFFIDSPALSDISIHREFTSYYSEYVFALKTICPNYKIPNSISIEFGEPPRTENWVGLCTTFDNTRDFIIQISARYWFDDVQRTKRKVLLFHELSHCLIKQPHSNDRDNYMYREIYYHNDLILSIQYQQDIKAYCNAN